MAEPSGEPNEGKLPEEFELEKFQKDFEARAEENRKKLKEVEEKMKELKDLMTNLETQKNEIQSIEGEISKLAAEMNQEAKPAAAAEAKMEH